MLRTNVKIYISFVGQSSPLNRIGFTQASQSLGLPATPSPDPGPSEEKENRPGTDHAQKKIFCLVECIDQLSYTAAWIIILKSNFKIKSCPLL